MKELVVKKKPFFYDAQIKRYLLQIAATAFAGFRVRSGIQKDGKTRDIDIPILMATYDRVVGYLRGDGNFNITTSVPILSMEMAGLSLDNERRRAYGYTETTGYEERIPEPMSEGNMNIGAGNTSENVSRKNIERHIPVPYIMTIRLTLWASNMDQAFQFVEQVGTIFNPEIDIQISNSPLDWTYMTILKFEGDFDFSKAGSDIGSNSASEYHLVEMAFTIPIWMNPPVKVYNSDDIREIHLRIHEFEKSIDDFATSAMIDGFIIRSE